MTDNEFLLADRLQKIRQVIGKYGEENFYISFSGGKDSTVLSALIDMAIPGNKIPRVYANTGIELNMIRDFVIDMAKNDERVEIIKPSVPIKKMLEEEGYPFKSKDHALKVNTYQNSGYTKTTDRYLNPPKERKKYACPKALLYQFTNECTLKISNKCCNELKKKPLHEWQKANNKRFAIIGIMKDEGGSRLNSHCITYTNSGNLKNFQPLVPVTKAWEEWFIDTYNIKICDIYKEPYNYVRTGCKGCPFDLFLQESLDTLEKFFPAERKQCEIIWKPVYDEYRRIGYRLKKDDGQMTLNFTKEV